ncbi:MAG TPA: FkbM family methyltransferase [Stellaceae bacterium]|jgi:FkbM family methyltransferase|nr:FkbM family methyltransferase [Stellaceae bacterium]
MTHLVSVFRRGYGIARSTVVYRGNPLKVRRARGFYRQFIRPGDLCFDVGAHVGDRLAHFLNLGARVVAVEPQPRLMAGLKRRFGNDPRVILVGAALGAARGKARLSIDPAHPTVATLSPDYIAQAGESRGFRHVRWREEIEVEVTTLDALIAAHGQPAFCKIDVEGYEHAVLEGLSRPLSGISLEYLPAALDPALVAIARLNRLGTYRFNRSVGESMALAIPRWLGAAEIGADLKRLPREDKAGDVYAFLDDGAVSR